LSHEHKLLFHLRMLTDSVRMEAYSRAIESTVRPGDVVVDLGSGSGILGLLAARAGASRVFCVEKDEYMVQRARRIVHDNGFDGIVEFLNTQIEDLKCFPLPVDVIVSETMGPAGIDEGIFQLFSHCVGLLGSRPRCIPDELTVLAAPMQVHELAERRAQASRVVGLDFSSLAVDIGSIAQILPVMPSMLVGPVGKLFHGAPGRDTLPEELTVTWDLPELSPVDAVGVWFSTRLTEDVALANPPEGPDTHWNQLVLPILPGTGPIRGAVQFTLWPRFVSIAPRWKWRLTWDGGEYTGDPADLDAPENLDGWLKTWGVTRKS